MRGITKPVYTKTIVEESDVQSFVFPNCVNMQFNHIRIEFELTDSTNVCATMSEGTNILMALKICNNMMEEVSISHNPEKGVYIGKRHDKEANKYHFIFYRPETPLSAISLQLIGKIKGTIKLSVIQEFGLDVLDSIFRDDRAFQQIIRWAWIHVTDKQNEIQISGICSLPVIEYLEKHHSQYSAMISFLKEIMNPILWPAYSREGIDTEPTKVFHNLLAQYRNVLEHLEKWKWFFEWLPTTDKNNFHYFLTENALRSIEINVSTLEKICSDLDANPRIGLPIDPQLTLNKIIEGLWGECRRMMPTFSAEQFAVLASRLLNLRLQIFNPDRAHHIGRNTKNQRYLFYEAMNQLELEPENFRTLSTYLEALKVVPQRANIPDSLRDLVYDLTHQCRTIIVRGVGLRQSYYKLKMHNELL